MDSKTYVFEGKTSTEAIEKGLKELNVSKNKVDIKILDQEDKRSFFSILTPRVVKVEMKLKEESNDSNYEKKNINNENVKEVDLKEYIDKVNSFMKEFIKNLPTNGLNYSISEEKNAIKVDIDGEDTGYLIGYRGEVLNSIQTILTNVVTRESKEKVRKS